MTIRVSAVVTIALSTLAGAGWADDASPDGEAPSPDKAEEAQPQQSVSLSVSNDFTSQYFFRGIVQETEGFIAQPGAEVGLGLFNGDGFVSGVTVIVGQWNSLHSGPSGGANTMGSGPRAWYEADFYAGPSLNFASLVDVGAVYVFYTSPNGSFTTVQEIAPSVALSDEPLWGGERFGGLNPTLAMAFETAVGQADGGEGKGIYGEVGLTPTLTVFTTEPIDMEARLPLRVGISLHDYYEDAMGNDGKLGYFDAGLALALNLGFMPEGLGAWSVYGGANVLLLGSGTKAINNGDRNALLGSGGIAMAL